MSTKTKTVKKSKKVSKHVKTKVHTKVPNKHTHPKHVKVKQAKSKHDKTTKKSSASKKSKTTSKITSKSASKSNLKSPTQNVVSKEVIIDSYNFFSGKIPILVTVKKSKGDFVPIYYLEISSISNTTEVVLERIRHELIKRVNLGIVDISDLKKSDVVEEKFDDLIKILIQKYFPDSDEETTHFLASYLKTKSLGLGSLDFIMSDENLEEIVVNQSSTPVWVYHKKYGWLKTNILLQDESQIRHYASIIGRRVGRQINVLMPLLDAHLHTGDRVNATLSPVSTEGNTITIRKFSKDPWTITKFLRAKTISKDAAALIWTAIQYEMSLIVAGGTASGKTSALTVFSSFFPPNQRIISIEDTREITLPKFLHWVPLNTQMANAEGKGQISMGDLLVNSLRMRPDRILVGEVRRKQETETLFEAIHTGHSVYATFHANTAKEAIDRLTNPPLDVPRIMLPAISLIVVQSRNRRSGKRRTFQIGEITDSGEINVLMQYDPKKDVLIPETNSIDYFITKKKSVSFFENLKLFTGLSESELKVDNQEKVKILGYLLKHNIDDVDAVGRIIAEYYTDKDNLMKFVNSDKLFTD